MEEAETKPPKYRVTDGRIFNKIPKVLFDLTFDEDSKTRLEALKSVFSEFPLKDVEEQYFSEVSLFFSEQMSSYFH